MKAFTLRQPWAWALIHAGKDIENRTWKTKFRGPLAIHSAKGMTKDDYYWDREWMVEAIGIEPPKKEDLTFGAIIGIVEVVDCVDDHTSPWFMGPYGFVVRNPIALAYPLPCKGALSFWTPPNDINEYLEDTWATVK